MGDISTRIRDYHDVRLFMLAGVMIITILLFLMYKQILHFPQYYVLAYSLVIVFLSITIFYCMRQISFLKITMWSSFKDSYIYLAVLSPFMIAFLNEMGVDLWRSIFINTIYATTIFAASLSSQIHWLMKESKEREGALHRKAKRKLLELTEEIIDEGEVDTSNMEQIDAVLELLKRIDKKLLVSVLETFSEQVQKGVPFRLYSITALVYNLSTSVFGAAIVEALRGFVQNT